MDMENNHNHIGEESVLEQRHKLSPGQAENILERVRNDLDELAKKLLKDELEYFVVSYPNKTVYIPKWTKIPHANNVGDQRHPHYVFSHDEDIEIVLARELRAAQDAWEHAKGGDIDKIEPIK